MREIRITGDDMATLLGGLLKQRLVCAGFKTEPGAGSFMVEVKFDLAGEVSLTRETDGTCIFRQWDEPDAPGVTVEEKPFMNEFTAQRDGAIKKALDEPG